MRAQAVLGVCVLACCGACGRVSNPGPPSANAAAAGAAGALTTGEGGDSQAGDSAAGDAQGGALDSDPTPILLTMDVVQRVHYGAWIPAPNAKVRIEGRERYQEFSSDSKGHVAASMDRNDAPWDVTIAMPQHEAITIMGVTGPISGAIHLSPFVYSTASNLQPLSGSINDAMLCLTDGFSLTGRGLDPASVMTPSLSQYTANVEASDSKVPLRLLASQWDFASASLFNASWVNVPPTGGALSANISFPSPPRATVTTAMELRLPSSGAVRGVGLVATPGTADRLEDGWPFAVGDSKAMPVPNETGRFAWTVRAFTGDMAPDQASLQLEDPAANNFVIATVPIKAGAVVTIPAAETLTATGDSVDTLSLHWAAPAYDLVGASLVPTLSTGGGWFIYSFEASSPVRPWPHLPSAISLADIGLADLHGVDLNVFAATETNGTRIWDWSANGQLLALVRKSRILPGEIPDPVIAPSPPADPLGSLSCAMNAIYATDSHTENDTGCAEEGPALSTAAQPYFIAMTFPNAMYLVSCSSLSDCREAAKLTSSGGAIDDRQSYNATSDIPSAVNTQSEFFTSLPDDQGICRAAGFQMTSLSTAPGGPLRLEQQVLWAPPFPADSAAGCSLALATTAAATSVCSELIVLKLHYVEAF
jgi:hypothetical protein